jgi:hypothetical protein
VSVFVEEVEHLVGMVVHDRGPAPVKRNRVVPKLPGELAVAHGIRIFEAPRGLTRRDERPPPLGELLGRRALSRKRGDRNRSRMIPVKIEGVGHLVDHRADDRHVKIGKIRPGMRAVIFVADVSPADDRDLPVGSERLVVHPLVDAGEVGDNSEQAERSHAHGVEHPHLDIRMAVDGEQDVVGGHRAEIVEQQAHAHAAVGGAEQPLDQNLAGQVLVPDVILHIEAALRLIRQNQPRGQSIARVRKRVEAGLSRMRDDAWPHRSRQRGAASIFQCRGRCATAALGKTRASCESGGSGKDGESSHKS